MTRTKRTLLTGAAIIAAGAMASNAAAQEQERYVFVHHASTGNVFWQSVQQGMVDACEQIGADCQMLFVQTEGDLQQQLNNFQTAAAQQPDGLITSIVDDSIFDEPIAEALDNGIPVIASNTDDSEGAAGNPRLSFIGQNLTAAGYSLAEAMSGQFPDDGAIQVLIGVSEPGQSWSELRAQGVADFMDDYIEANPDRDISYERLDSGTDLAATANRVAAYVQANPELTAYFDTGYWHAGAANALRDLGYEPGQILLGGFDLVPVVLDEMEAGYIQYQVDQQPYLQGYLPIIQLHLMNELGLGAWDVDTGQALVTPDEVGEIRSLAEEHRR
jgi:simple sugar transport system substrate-binding protein